MINKYLFNQSMFIWGKGRAAGRVGLDFLSAIVGRVESKFRRVGSGRVQEKWPVDNSELIWIFEIARTS